MWRRGLGWRRHVLSRILCEIRPTGFRTEVIHPTLIKHARCRLGINSVRAFQIRDVGWRSRRGVTADGGRRRLRRRRGRQRMFRMRIARGRRRPWRRRRRPDCCGWGARCCHRRIGWRHMARVRMGRGCCRRSLRTYRLHGGCRGRRRRRSRRDRGAGMRVDCRHLHFTAGRELRAHVDQGGLHIICGVAHRRRAVG